MLKVVGFICCLNLVQNYMRRSEQANHKCLYFANAYKIDALKILFLSFLISNLKN